MIIEKNNINFKFNDSVNHEEAVNIITKFFKYLDIVLNDRKYGEFLKYVDYTVEAKLGANYSTDDKTMTIPMFDFGNLDEVIYNELVHVKVIIDNYDMLKKAMNEKINNALAFLSEYYAIYETKLYFYNKNPDILKLKGEIDSMWREKKLYFEKGNELISKYEKILKSNNKKLISEVEISFGNEVKEFKKNINYFNAQWLGNVSVYNQYSENKFTTSYDEVVDKIANYIDSINYPITIEDLKYIEGLL
ncbi:hypothetical protein [Clostridium cellulovorans]|uniref:Uncharacterized protein n=1 Tax=Clostridium cellulovorans (strain ATCC 35296 / DSM 3052 / OCM 3 / 743B) TaxID=573061 RepID=D9SN61_CLOC7|nr:hypothetical protein [Clostridium cellulovorans]ADL51927.1 hypothetical protein Clocel_2186 [Clostridium cellulovorans 743B]